MMQIPFSPPDITEAEIEEVAAALRSGWITTGPRTKELERQVAARCGTKKAVCLNSQTACAEMVLRLMEIGPGDEVILPAYTYTATASVVQHVGAAIVMVDCQKDSLEMDYDSVEKAVTSRTKAIILNSPCNPTGSCLSAETMEKIARIVDCFARRLQIQERLTEQVAEAIQDAAKAEGVGVVFRCRHLCMMMRGVEKQNSEMVTSAMLGSFREDEKVRQEFLSLVNR